MGYFSNGTEGDAYREAHCAKCVHDQEEGGCPVWNAHLTFNSAQLKEDDGDGPLGQVLAMLIPRGKGCNLACTMFVPLKQEAKGATAWCTGCFGEAIPMAASARGEVCASCTAERARLEVAHG